MRTTIGMGGTILAAAALGFLGLGAPPPDAGMGPDDRRKPRVPAPGLVVRAAPGIAILLVVMGFNLLGDGLRDVLDPRIRRSADGR